MVRCNYPTRVGVFGMTEKDMPEYDIIRAAVAGEKWAVEKVLECYSDELDRLATRKERQPDGSVKQVVDEDMRQTLTLKLMEAIPQFPLDESEREEAGSGNEKS
jgi:hypothetical protein